MLKQNRYCLTDYNQYYLKYWGECIFHQWIIENGEKIGCGFNSVTTFVWNDLKILGTYVWTCTPSDGLNQDEVA